MVLERIEAQIAAERAEEDEFGENEERPGELTRIQQEDEEKKEIARRKRHFIVNVQKGTDDYIHMYIPVHTSR